MTTPDLTTSDGSVIKITTGKLSEGRQFTIEINDNERPAAVDDPEELESTVRGRFPWFQRQPVVSDRRPRSPPPAYNSEHRKEKENKDFKSAVKDVVTFAWFERVESRRECSQNAPAHSVSRGKERRNKLREITHYHWFHSIFNSLAGPSMQRLLITKSKVKKYDDDDGGEVHELRGEIESSHEYSVRPGVPFFLKYFISPLIMTLQFVVFLEIYKKKKNSCTDYQLWSPETKFGIGLATIYICAQICAQLFHGVRIFLAGWYSKQPWAVLLSAGMLTQFAFEIVVYSAVMATSVDLEDLIKDFIALAVANETDDKLGGYLKIKSAKKIMFLDEIEEGETAQLQRDSNQLKEDNHARNMLRSSMWSANHWDFLLHHEKAWGVRLLLLAGICAAVFSQVLVVWDTPCSQASIFIRTAYNSTIIPPEYAINCSIYNLTDGHYYKQLQDFAVEGVFTDGKDTTYDVDFRQYGFTFPYASDYIDNPTTYSGVSITSRGLYQLTGVVKDSFNFPDTAPSYGSQIAPFFANYKVNFAHGGAFYVFGTLNNGNARGPWLGPYPSPSTSTTPAPTFSAGFQPSPTTSTTDSTASAPTSSTTPGRALASSPTSSSSSSSITELTETGEIIFILQKGLLDTTCTTFFFADGWCDEVNNNAECNWDFGDCCPNECGQVSLPDSIYSSMFSYASSSTSSSFSWSSSYSFSSSTNSASSTDTTAPTPAPTFSTSTSTSSTYGSTSTSNSSYTYYECGSNGYTCLGSVNATYTPPPKQFITYELILSACGDVTVSFPHEFDLPDSNDYTIGFQWQSADATQLTSNCRGVECNAYFGLTRGSMIFLDASEGIPISDSTYCGYYTEKARTAKDAAVKAVQDAGQPALLSLVCDSKDFSTLGDGNCDESQNTPSCRFDLGDCCASTCQSDHYRCGRNPYNCIDPCEQGDLTCESSTTY